MKRIFLIGIFVSLFAFCFSVKAGAVGAVPYPVTVKQPDGSTITIRVHGDEYLNWVTCGNSLVSQGPDGYYYYATFNAKGGKILNGKRVPAGSGSFGTSGANIVPPATAIQDALQMRRLYSERNARDRHVSLSSQSRNGLMSASASASNSISIGTKKFLVILIQFPDRKFSEADPKSSFTNLLNQSGYSYNGATGSVRDYYMDNSNSKLDPTFDVYGPYTATNNLAYYGAQVGTSHDSHPRELLSEACKALDGEIDYSKYDNDKDGYADEVYYYFAGYSQAEGASSDCIWPHSWYLNPGGSSGDYSVSADGVIVDKYACGNELRGTSGTTLAGIGTFCHEFGHVLGLPDFYDTDYETNGSAPGLYNFSLMSSGNYNNEANTPPYLTAIERQMLGWMDITELTSPGSYTLKPISDTQAYMTASGTSKEYFVYENRQNNKWDAYLDAHGLIIYHVDQSSNTVATGITAADLWSSNDINSYSSHECCKIMNPGNTKYSATFPGTINRTEFTASTTPGAVNWAGKSTGFNLSDIKESGSDIIFNLLVGSVTNLYLKGYDAIATTKSSYSAGDSFTLKINKSINPSTSVKWYFDGVEKSDGTAIVLTAGSHVAKAVLSYSDGSSETVFQEIIVK